MKEKEKFRKKIGMVLRFILIPVAFLFVGLPARSQNIENKNIAEGNAAYRKGNFTSAIDFYNKALANNPANDHARINKAITLNKEHKTDEANQLYDEVLQSVTDKDLQSTAYYNKGVNEAKGNKYDEAIKEFKDALRRMPNDQQARENLQLAINKKKTEQDKDKNQQQEKNKDNQEQPQQNQPNQEQPQNKEKQPNKSNISNEQAERYLDNLKEEEKNLQNKIMKRGTSEGQREKRKGW